MINDKRKRCPTGKSLKRTRSYTILPLRYDIVIQRAFAIFKPFPRSKVSSAGSPGAFPFVTLEPKR